MSGGGVRQREPHDSGLTLTAHGKLEISTTRIGPEDPECTVAPIVQPKPLSVRHSKVAPGSGIRLGCSTVPMPGDFASCLILWCLDMIRAGIPELHRRDAYLWHSMHHNSHSITTGSKDVQV
jgi:hypothetical protein